MIEIVEVNNKLGNGCTFPYVVWCNDGKKYVAKFPGNPEGFKALINEFIASKLCDYLKLPIMQYELISVKKDNYNESMMEYINPIDGTAFATIYDDRLLNVLNAGEIKRCKNSYDAVKILIFDLLIGNSDRNKGNLMINSNTKKLIMIDHTHIFNIGVLWDKYQLKRLRDEPFDLSNLHPYNRANIMDSLCYDDVFYFELNKFVKMVKNIDGKYVEKIMDDLPSDWEVTNDEKLCLIDFIVCRFKRIDEILELLNLKGGDNSEN